MSRASERLADSERKTVATLAAPTDVAISVRDLSKRYRLEKVRVGTVHGALLRPLARLLTRDSSEKSRGFIWALNGLNFDVARGERVAIIGANGAGKSTLLKILSRIVVPTRGEARIRGRVTSLLEVGVGFENKLTGRENVYVNAAMHGVSKRDINQRFDEIVEFSGIDTKFIDTRVRYYSTGMRVRLAFSVAAHLDPDILLLDEVLSVGDAAFQAKCLERVEGMMKERRTLLFVSHSMASVTRFCDRAIWLREGRIVADGPATDVAAMYSEQVRESISGRRLLEVPQPEPTPVEDEVNIEDAAVDDSDMQLGDDGTFKEQAGAEFVSVRVIDEARAEVRGATADQKLGIEFVYDVLRPNEIVLPVAKFFNADGIQMFSAVYTDPEYMDKPKDRGRYVSIVWLPEHFFNIGMVYVTVALTTPKSGALVRHVMIDQALSFEVFEIPYGEPSACGSFKALNGVLRPMLDWETKAL